MHFNTLECRVKCVPMQPWHLMSVALRLRGCDFAQFEALCPERDPQVWACKTVLRSGVAFAIVNAEGMPVACLGVVCEDNEIGDMWFVATDEFTRSIRAQGVCDKVARTFASHGKYKRLRATCSTEHPYASRTLRFLGFSERGRCSGFGREGSDLIYYSMDIAQVAQREAA